MLARLEGYAAAQLGQLDTPALGVVIDDLVAIETTVLSNAELRGVLSDTSISGVARGAILDDLMRDKIADVARQLVVYAAIHAPAPDVAHEIGSLAHVARNMDQGTFVLRFAGLLEARRRVFGFADAVLEHLEVARYADVEDDLFRWARTVEATPALRRLLLDRDAPIESRLGVTDALLAEKVHPTSWRLARYVVEGGRPRDVVGTLDALVDYVAEARNWRVARVRSARELSEESRGRLAESLRSLTGTSVEVEVTLDPSLLSGVLVEVGDLRLDASTQGRLGALHDVVTAGHYVASVLESHD